MTKLCWKGRAFKALSFGTNSKKAGRNFSGSITIFHRGGGAKRLFRRIDFQRKNLAKGLIERIEYDPNRTARIALVRWSNKKLSDSVEKNNRAEAPSTHRSGTTTMPANVDVPKQMTNALGQRRSSLTARSQPNETLGSKDALHAGLDDRSDRRLTCKARQPIKYSSGVNRSERFARFERFERSGGRFSYILASDQLKSGDEVFNIASKLARSGADFESDQPDSNETFGSFSSPLGAKHLEDLYQKRGISLPLWLAPLGSVLHNIELYPGAGGKVARAAGTYAQLVQKPQKCDLSFGPWGSAASSEYSSSFQRPRSVRIGPSTSPQGPPKGWTRPELGLTATGKREVRQDDDALGAKRAQLGAVAHKGPHMCTIRLPSGQQQLLDLRCRATIGVVSNIDHRARILTKAGQRRWLGFRPVVRGVAMNPIDHPHGGGEGRTKGGRPSVSPWGKPTKGRKVSQLRCTSRKGPRSSVIK